MWDDDDDLLNAVGLTRQQLDDILSKVDTLVESLTPEQQQALRMFRGEGKEAAQVLRKSVKPGELEAFIETRTQSGVVVTLKKTTGL